MLILAGCLSALCACGPLGGASIVVTAAQNGSTVQVPMGDAFEIRLSGNETVYPPDQWQAEPLPPNVRLDRTDHESDAPGAMGAGGTTIFRFTAISPGPGLLSFNSGPSQRRFRVTISAE